MICYTVIIEAFINSDNDYNEKKSYGFDDLTNFKMYFYTSYGGIELRLVEIKNNKPLCVFNILECNKQNYYDYFIETLKQMK